VSKKNTKKMAKQGNLKAPPKQGPSTRARVPRRAAKNRTAWRPFPTEEELERARTPRKQNALKTWYQRLRELIEFQEQNGHSKYSSIFYV
jgi:hypothetical protein